MLHDPLYGGEVEEFPEEIGWGRVGVASLRGFDARVGADEG